MFVVLSLCRFAKPLVKLHSGRAGRYAEGGEPSDGLLTRRGDPLATVGHRVELAPGAHNGAFDGRTIEVRHDFVLSRHSNSRMISLVSIYT